MKRLGLTGQILWLLGVGLLIVCGMPNSDPWTIWSSVLFGVGILFFLLPLLGNRLSSITSGYAYRSTWSEG